MRPLAARVERQRLGAFGLVGTGLLHLSLLLLVIAGSRRSAPARILPAYRVDLVAAPRAAGPVPGTAPAPPTPAVRTPAPAPAPTPPAARTAPPRRDAAPVPRTTARAPSTAQNAPGASKAPATGTPAGAAKAATAVPGGAEGAVGGTGADPATIRTEGVEFPFPGYLRNLVAQVFRRWRPPPGNSSLEAEILFLVHRDGTISGLTFVRRSGSFGFDLEAQGAVEAAARGGAFGTLPPAYGADVLPRLLLLQPEVAAVRACGRAGVLAYGRAAPAVMAAVRIGVGVAALLCARTPARLYAQDTLQGGVRVGITYTPGRRPALAVVRAGSGAAVDSAWAVLMRDLDHSDRFELVRGPVLERGDTTKAAVLTRIAGSRAADLLVVVEAKGPRTEAVAYDVARNAQLHRAEFADATAPAARRGLHAAADAIVAAATGQAGIAATQVLFVRNGRLVRVDADGHGGAEVRSAGNPSLSPAWAPDGRRIAYTAFVRSGTPIVLQDLATGRRTIVPTTEQGLNITPVFAPDGRRLAFARGTEAGTDIYLTVVNGLDADVPQRLTVGRFADNLSPAWSPDGARLAFISTRARTPQLYVMGADGTGQEVLARFDYGATGTTSAPVWSPDGQFIAFHREVGGTPQLFVVDVATRAVRQLTGSGRNEDPTWAPDGRHLAFVSSRGGGRDLWVLDLETGRVRQLTTTGGARLPAWSPRLSAGGTP